jgi:N,N'-diacetyllegionaminate synthase
MKNFPLIKKVPFIIAEAGVNHNGDVHRAMRMVDVAVESGADCVKFQAFTAKELVMETTPLADYQKNEFCDNQLDLLSSCELKKEDIFKIKSYCDEKNIIFSATPFSVPWVKELQKMGILFFKVGSGNLNELELLTSIGKARLPVILSTGMFYLNEIGRSVDILKKNGVKDIALLHCISLYPVEIKRINLFSMHRLQKEFNLPVGFSDHTQEIFTGSLAVAAGATIIEKHFTLDKNLAGPDQKMSLDPDELKKYINLCRQSQIICGDGRKNPLYEELDIRDKVTFSIVSNQFIPKGIVIEREMLCFKRAEAGISSIYIDRVVGSFSKSDISKNEIITNKHF